MNDISYEILDLFKKYGADKEGILKILEAAARKSFMPFQTSVAILWTGWIFQDRNMYCSLVLTMA